MNSQSENFDWQLFWLLEVIFLGLPTLITIIAFRDGPSLSLRRATVLAIILIGLTVFNLILGRARIAISGRIREH